MTAPLSAIPRACVIGDPVAHSLSPVIHGHWLAELGLPGDYTRAHVAAPDLLGFLNALDAEGYVGANITIPHKSAALGFVDTLDPSAAGIGAINTIFKDADGRWVGANSDVTGFLAHLDQTVPDWREKTDCALVLGAGGAARAVLKGLDMAGVSDIRMVNRSVEKLRAVIADIRPGTAAITWDERNDALVRAQLIVNTTNLGMSGAPPLDLDLKNAASDAIVYDIVYAPLETDLLKSAKALGMTPVDGLGMLLHQARLGFEKWFGARPDVTPALRAAVLAALARKSA